MNILLKQNTKGSALLSVIIVLPFLIAITLSYMSLSITSLRLAVSDEMRTHAQLAVDAGLDIAAREINLNPTTWSGSAGEEVVLNANNVITTYETTVTVINDDRKLITATGRTYNPASDYDPISGGAPSADITIKVEMRAVRSGFFSIVTGVGGLYMSNNSKILGGDVFVNGELRLSNSAQIGLADNPVNIDVAHQNCPTPPDTNYPRICDSGENGQPINLTNNAQIYGTVNANNQTNGSSMSSPGLVSNCQQPSTAPDCVEVSALPAHNRAQQVSNVAFTENSSYYTNCDANNTTRTWPARLKIEGDVSIKKGCTVILEGDVWITGRLTVQNSAQIKTAENVVLGGQNTVSSEHPTVMVDGSAGVVLQNSGKLASNSDSVGMQVITYWSRAACSPDCATVTGQDLYNSREDRTILLQNSSEAPNTLLYSRWTQAELGNGGSVGAVVGQTVRLTNSATITFGTSAGTGTSYWVIDGYRRSF